MLQDKLDEKKENKPVSFQQQNEEIGSSNIVSYNNNENLFNLSKDAYNINENTF